MSYQLWTDKEKSCSHISSFQTKTVYSSLLQPVALQRFYTATHICLWLHSNTIVQKSENILYWEKSVNLQIYLLLSQCYGTGIGLQAITVAVSFHFLEIWGRGETALMSHGYNNLCIQLLQVLPSVKLGNLEKKQQGAHRRTAEVSRMMTHPG